MKRPGGQWMLARGLGLARRSLRRRWHLGLATDADLDLTAPLEDGARLLAHQDLGRRVAGRRIHVVVPAAGRGIAACFVRDVEERIRAAGALRRVDDVDLAVVDLLPRAGGRDLVL